MNKRVVRGATRYLPLFFLFAVVVSNKLFHDALCEYVSVCVCVEACVYKSSFNLDMQAESFYLLTFLRE
jgi:hypothetical protein